MTACKAMIKASIFKAKAQFQECENLELSKRGNWTLAEDFSVLRLGNLLLGRIGRR